MVAKFAFKVAFIFLLWCSVFINKKFSYIHLKEKLFFSKRKNLLYFWKKKGFSKVFFFLFEKKGFFFLKDFFSLIHFCIKS